MHLRTLAWMVGAGIVLTGCFFTEPINRRPRFSTVNRRCEAPYPAELCNNANVHYGDSITVEASFADPDGNPRNGSAHWRISACGPTNETCSTDRLYDSDDDDDPDTAPTFVVRRVPDSTGTLFSRIVFEVSVYDERGASSDGDAE